MTGAENGGIRLTEADGIRVTWRIDRPHRIVIMAVHNMIDNSPMYTFGPDCPDLVQARDRMPKLAKAWDAVRHQFWMQWGSPHWVSSAVRHADELPSIKPWVCAIEERAGDGYHVEREPNPPYGWNLFDPAGAVVCSGSLDRLELWVLHRTTRPQ
ncbi:hypothetical protein [Nocardia terpenica]|uniref:Uncharacterized protein n=1 Tax=Nocardia terpenica TaxID=455432 RepID=A0A6G9Z418_9NOCA|nr:hypothetical protein [Nocardia terpenica]QIS20278.1 hypothetical protein F6W96_20260 [Nocardia terpenica]